MKVLTIVGARPQFIKAAIVSKAFEARPEIQECIVHTGQHYDQQMSQVFFEELGIPKPGYRLEVGSASHGRQTGKMLAGIEEVLEHERPAVVLVYGDTNSTLAGALAAAKMHIPVVHVEAGLRSFNRRMPEEINRVLTDDLSTLLLCPNQGAVDNLRSEGVREGVHLVGDVMYDASMRFSELAGSSVDPLHGIGVRAERYVLMTCHRAENTDDRSRLSGILGAANRIAAEVPVVFPVHPRTRHILEDAGIELHPGVKAVDPVSYLEMLVLERSASAIMTDSGGVQKEAFFFGVPCVTMRDETEWTETIETGANTLTGADPERIHKAVGIQIEKRGRLPEAGPYYGNGEAATTVTGLVAAMNL